jgi:hypothetical protein
MSKIFKLWTGRVEKKFFLTQDNKDIVLSWVRMEVTMIISANLWPKSEANRISVVIEIHSLFTNFD